MSDPSASADVPSGGSRFERWWLDALHLVALSSVAVAWPLLDLLAKNNTFFAAHEMTAQAILLFALGLLVVPPLFATAFVLAVRLLSAPAGRYTQALSVGVFCALIVCTPLANATGGSTTLQMLLYLVVALLVALAYARSDVVRRFVTIATPAPLVFLVLFVWFSPVSAYFSTARAVKEARTSGKPVVMLLLDEMSLGSILDERNEIDAERFPSFARLARGSTWYRNATTNANQTHHAMPATLTGEYPRIGKIAPIQSEYPNNLFTWLQGNYELRADEWVTRLCPTNVCRHRLVSYAAVKHIAVDTALVYLRLAAPPAIRYELPEIGEQWAGFFAKRLTAQQRIERTPRVVRPVMRPLFDRLADPEFGSVELRRATAFTRSITKPDRPTFWFLHVGLPHVPWNLLPDARTYDHEPTLGATPSGRIQTPEAADDALQRYLVQVQATDRVIGSLIDRLVSERMWDDTLLVVQADHGRVLESGKRPRELEGAESEILPIPLFIHYPGQRRGRIDDGRAELVDVAPTIADALGTSLPWDTDGTSLRRVERPERPRRVWAFGEEAETFTYTDGSFGPGFRRVRALFGERRVKDDLFAWGPHRRLVGRSVDDLDIDATVSVALRIDRPGRYDHVDPDGPWLPARISGSFRAKRPWSWFAVAVNGRVAGLSHPFVSRTAHGVYAILASPRFFEPGRNEIQILGFSNDGAITLLR